jgi:hypothetical protein
LECVSLVASAGAREERVPREGAIGAQQARVRCVVLGSPACAMPLRRTNRDVPTTRPAVFAGCWRSWGNVNLLQRL